jgi:hypothetical protein
MIVPEYVHRRACREALGLVILRCEAFPNTHTEKTRESVAKSLWGVNEKNVQLAWRHTWARLL